MSIAFFVNSACLYKGIIILIIVDRDMVWKLGKLQSTYNELRFDVETVLAVHKSIVSSLLIFKQHG